MLFAVGLLAGAALAVGAITIVMRRRMIEVLPSRFPTVDETVAALEARIAAAEGWSSPGTRDLNGMLARHGVAFAPRVRLVELCRATYAAQVLRDARHAATLMPCAIAVYEDDAGNVWLSKLNTGLVARVFGGTIARIMGGGVAVEEGRILGALRG